jgi:protein-tyrosine-phosphatase
MAAAFAERERTERNLEDVIEIHSGGTDPADAVHEEVVEAMAEVGIDIEDKTPKYVADLDNLKDTDYLVTMGCSITKLIPHSTASSRTNGISGIPTTRICRPSAKSGTKSNVE